MSKSLSAAALASAAMAVPSAASAQLPDWSDVEKQIEANDAALFWAAFEGCDSQALEGLLTEDYRMLHDLAGLAVSGREAFIADMTQQCAARAEGGANEGYKNRRLLVPGSRSITPLDQWGALERGYHTFQELRERPAGWYGDDDPGGPSWVQTGGAHYIHVWQWMAEEGAFRLAESISVDHGAAPAYPPTED